MVLYSGAALKSYFLPGCAGYLVVHANSIFAATHAAIHAKKIAWTAFPER